MESLSLTGREVAHEHAAAADASPEVEALWFRVAAHPWRALLVVPAPGTSALHVAQGLLRVARSAETNASLVDGTRVSVNAGARLATELASRTRAGERVIVAVDSVDENPAGLALSAHCDAAILCVTLGRSDADSARRTVEQCGRERFLGSAVVVPSR